VTGTARATSPGRPILLVPLPPPEPPNGAAPRLDYLEIAEAVNGRILYSAPRGAFVATVHRLGDWPQGLRARRSDAPGFISMSEKSALPLALLARRRPHVAIAHRLTTQRRRALQRRTGWLRGVDRVIVLCRTQERYLLEEAGLPRERVRFIHDNVDHHFFAPVEPEGGGYVLSVGQTQRDYNTFAEAMRGLEARGVIVASSPWTGVESAGPARAPANVEVVRGIPATRLRDLYAGAAVVAVPLLGGLDFAAGVNALLEGMAMARPVVVTEIPGLADYVDGGRIARLVPPGDPVALRESLAALLSDVGEAARLGAAGRAVVEQGRNLDTYVDRVVATFREVAP
jgi:glycosyltransferase involved in cell wall biosynthesis